MFQAMFTKDYRYCLDYNQRLGTFVVLDAETGNWKSRVVGTGETMAAAVASVPGLTLDQFEVKQ